MEGQIAAKVTNPIMMKATPTADGELLRYRVRLCGLYGP